MSKVISLLTKKDTKGNLNKLDKLLEKKPELVNAMDKSGLTPLCFATKEGYADKVKILLDANADPNLPDKDGWPPILQLFKKSYSVLFENEAKCLRYLFDAGVDANFRFGPHEIPGLIMVTALFKMKPATGEQRVLDIVNLFIEYGYKVDNYDQTGKKTLMHFAANYGMPKLVSFLIDKGADISLANSEGQTALNEAKIKISEENCTGYSRYEEVIELLTPDKLDVNQSDAPSGKTENDFDQILTFPTYNDERFGSVLDRIIRAIENWIEHFGSLDEVDTDIKEAAERCLHIYKTNRSMVDEHGGRIMSEAFQNSHRFNQIIFPRSTCPDIVGNRPFLAFATEDPFASGETHCIEIKLWWRNALSPEGVPEYLYRDE